MQVNKINFDRNKNKIEVSEAVVNNKTADTSEKIIVNLSHVLLEMLQKLSLIHISEPTRPY